MERPKDWDNVREYGEREQFMPGGHVMKILKVEETTSSTNKAMLKIYMDTDPSDKQPNYFKSAYNSDNRENKRWGCIMNVLVEDSRTGLTNPALKTFVTAVEKSNSSAFKVKWGAGFCDCFKDRLVGCLFRREQYINRYGETPKLSWSVKPFLFRSIAGIREDTEIPKDKPLSDSELEEYRRLTGDVLVSANNDDDLPPPPSEPPMRATNGDYPF